MEEAPSVGMGPRCRPEGRPNQRSLEGSRGEDLRIDRRTIAEIAVQVFLVNDATTHRRPACSFVRACPSADRAQIVLVLDEVPGIEAADVRLEAWNIDQNFGDLRRQL